jgi:hypothetical protein
MQQGLLLLLLLHKGGLCEPAPVLIHLDRRAALIKVRGEDLHALIGSPPSPTLSSCGPVPKKKKKRGNGFDIESQKSSPELST